MITADILGERARLSPDKTALVFAPTGERITYAELNRRAAAMAAIWLEHLNLSAGDRIGILAGNRPEYVAALFAAAKTGIVLVPLNARLARPELEAIARDSGMSALLYSKEYEGGLSVKRSLCLDSMPAEPLVPGPLGSPQPEHLLCLLYTSGTTGVPKGVMIPHRMAAWNAYNTVVSWGLREDDIAPVFTPLYHAGGLAVFLTPLFLAGGTIILHAKFDPAAVWRSIEEERCSVVFGVPATFQMLMESAEFAATDTSRIRWLISGGAPLPAYIIEAYQRRGLIFKQGYGMTEVGVNCFAMSDTDSVRKPGSIGKPMLFTEACVVDNTGHPSPPGENGELWLRGPHVSRGYWNNPEATAAAIDPEGWFHTGDVARVDSEGFFSISGRAKDMFISGGINVYPAEVEQVLLHHPFVQDAAVIGVPDPKWGEAGAAFVVPRPGVELKGPDLVAFLTPLVARYKIPAHFFFTKELPRTAYGKVVKPELAARYRELRP